MGIKFCSLSSGSSGNCQYIETDRVRVLVDAGFSGKRIENLLSSIGVCPSTIDCMFITHEHRDHIKGAGVLSRRYDIPIFANEGTWTNMSNKIGELRDKNINIIQTDKDFEIGDLGILPFKVFHDAYEPVGYILYHKDIKITIMTDTGWVNNEIRNKIKGSSLYLLESNHDVNMLKYGKYPWYLKKRISSTQGHLSNDDAGEILSQVLLGEGEIILLAHLSQENNIPSLAQETVGKFVKKSGINTQKDITLDLTYRDRPTKVYNL
mgnify:CR=1 FL=1